MKNYKHLYYTDDSNISLEHWTGSSSQSLHMHKYYELVLIEKGSCLHIYQDHETMLIPGDSFLVPPESAHCFDIHEHTSIYNCQFFANAIDNDTFTLIKNFHLGRPGTDDRYNLAAGFTANINKQGIIHLMPGEFAFLRSLLEAIKAEQEKQELYTPLLKRKYLEIIIITYCKRMEQQFKNYFSQDKGQQTMILKVLAHIETSLTDKIDFREIAIANGLSPNHFRKLFKDAIGLTPVEYANRLRITKACEYLQSGDLNISELAAKVGIYDSNYFSRLFKQYMGYAPKKYLTRTDNQQKIQLYPN